MQMILEGDPYYHKPLVLTRAEIGILTGLDFRFSKCEIELIVGSSSDLSRTDVVFSGPDNVLI